MKHPLQLSLLTLSGLWLLTIQPALAQRVTATQPTPNATSAPRSTSVAITTDQALPSDAQLRVFSARAGGQKMGTTQVQGNTVRFMPRVGFQPGERVLVTGTPLSPAGLGYVFEFTTAAGRAPATFSGTAQVGVGSSPYSVVAADVDGDGDLDILTANFLFATVSVRLNDGKGQFSGTTQVGVGDYPQSVAAADVDGDGDLDILTANARSNDVSVRLNDSRGSFSESAQVGVGDSPYSVVAADMDGDGDLDILTANYNSSDVSVRLNDGRGRFLGTTQVGVGSSPRNVVAADVDGDGDLDILTANYLSDNVSVRLNNGSGQFSATTELSVGIRPFGVVAADVDGDGDLDILTANSGSDDVSIRLNNGRGNFSESAQVGVGDNPRSVVAADVDGDGDLDVLTANVGNNDVSVRLNDGRGRFQGTTQVGVGVSPNSVVAADVDGDGDLDVLTANVGTSDVSVRLNGGTALPVTLASFTAQAQGDWVQLAWQTQAQTNFAGFQIERSVNAQEFMPLSWLPSLTPSAAPTAYGYTDWDLPARASALYYRLKLVDLDGSLSYSAIRSVSLRESSLGLRVLGNPVRGSLTLLVSSPLAQSLALRLVSSSGQLVIQQSRWVVTGRSEWALDLGSLSPGVYELAVSAGTQQRSQRLLIE